MATKSQKPDWVKARVTTPRMSMSIDGGLDESIEHIFVMVGTVKRREAVLKKLSEAHQRMIERAQEKLEG